MTGPGRTPLTPGLGNLGSFLAVAVGGLAVAVAALWGFGELTLIPAVTRIDHPILEFFARHRVEWISDLMTRVTWIGSYEFTVGLGAVAGVWLVVMKRAWPAPALLAAVWLEVLLVQNLLNVWVAGSVPPDAVALGPPGPYPSGGAARLTGVAVLAAGLLARAHGRRAARWVWIATFASVALEVASRIYLGRHWPIDVVGGVLMGALLAGVLLLATSFLSHPRPGWRRTADASRSRRRP